jgi:hypothetical protein
MEVILNDKVYKGVPIGLDELQIAVKGKDLLFFKKWQEKTFDKKKGQMREKTEYMENVEFKTTTEKGILIDCFPDSQLSTGYTILRWKEKKLID